MAATLPQFLEMERKHGSLIRAMRVKKSRPETQTSASGARYGMFLAPRRGMQQLVDAVAARVPAACVRLNSPVEKVGRSPAAPWQVTVRGQSPELFDDLVLATPAPVSRRLMEEVDSDLASLIGRIPYAGCCVVLVGCRRDRIKHPLDGFGLVVPAVENRKIIACSLASVKFPGRAPEGNVLLRVFIGGALQPELMDQSDSAIKQLVLHELAELIGLSGEPEFCDIARWHGAMPQYHVGHLDLVRQIEERAAAIPHFALAVNAYRGVGVPFCVKSGEDAAQRIAVAWASPTTT
jgi:oxygen-dependent protoporphyrinogen oxidase